MTTRKAKRPSTGSRRVRAKSWQLRLYVTGQTARSLAAFSNLQAICESRLKGRYRITVIDLLEQPHLASGDQILAVPTVVRRLPKPVRTIIGDLSGTAQVLVGLDLRPAGSPAPTPVKTNKTRRATQALEKALVARPKGRYVLRLFVAGATTRSRQAILRVRELCDADLRGNCDLEVIDIYQQPGLAREHQIVATPTLVKERPQPMRRFIGNLSNIAGLLAERDLVPGAEGAR